jgi:hypothetical protein
MSALYIIYVLYVTWRKSRVFFLALELYGIHMAYIWHIYCIIMCLAPNNFLYNGCYAHLYKYY